MIKRTLAVALVVGFYVFLSGCATIVKEVTTNPVPITSKPSDAKLEIIDTKTGECVISAKTPYEASLKSGAGYFKKSSYKIRISKDGYMPQERDLEAELNGWYWANIAFGGIIGFIAVDPVTGAMWKVPEDPIDIALVEDLSAKTRSAQINVQSPSPSLKPQQSVITPPVSQPKKRAPQVIYYE